MGSPLSVFPVIASLSVVLLLGTVGCGEPPESVPPGAGVPVSVAPHPDDNGDLAAVADTLPVAEFIRERLEAGLAMGAPRAAGDRIHSMETLPAFYVERDFEPAWLRGPRPTPAAQELIRAVRDAERDGLDPRHYHLGAIDSLIPRLGGDGDDELRRRVDVDLLLTDAFLILGSHLHLGRVNPETRDPEWRANRRGADLGSVLKDALESGEVARALDDLRPREDTYHGLRDALVHYRRLAAEGGWAAVPSGPILEPGDAGPRVVALRARLAATGDLPASAMAGGDLEDELFDEVLATAVRRFQRRMGLEPDGRVGPASLRAMNVPVQDRIAQLEVNLERWRWMPQELGERYFLVNIPAFSVELWEEGEKLRELRAIVGRAYRATPVFSSTMTYLVLAPHWHVPPGIAQNDQLPRIRENPGYIASQRMVLLDQGTNRVVDPHGIDWTGMTGAEFNRRFRLRQDPGPNNALGAVKFIFPNRHNVYLHDTPGRELFDRAARDFSSGCIRVEGALELAAHLLRHDPSWTPERIREVVQGGRERYVNLPVHYRVHLQYWTAWLDEEGRVNFRNDIYDRDPRVREALRQNGPRD
jgi:L,D-transpeptidase YcbB